MGPWVVMGPRKGDRFVDMLVGRGGGANDGLHVVLKAAAGRVASPGLDVTTRLVGVAITNRMVAGLGFAVGARLMVVVISNTIFPHDIPRFRVWDVSGGATGKCWCKGRTWMRRIITLIFWIFWVFWVWKQPPCTYRF